MRNSFRQRMADYCGLSPDDEDSIHRQFRLSIGLVVAMAFAAFVLGFVLPVAPHINNDVPVAIHTTGSVF